jgi:hypothetical protein
MTNRKASFTEDDVSVGVRTTPELQGGSAHHIMAASSPAASRG